MARQAEHCLLDNRQCAAMGRVLALEQRVRHSLIHPSPRLPRDGLDADREMEFRNLSFDDVARLCDDVIETIFAIDGVLDGIFGRAKSWLSRRDQASGVFGEAVFK